MNYRTSPNFTDDHAWTNRANRVGAAPARLVVQLVLPDLSLIPSLIVPAIAVALFIAVIKGTLVASYFMHLISERKLIYGLLGFTVFFFLGLICLTVWAFADFPTSTVTH